MMLILTSLLWSLELIHSFQVDTLSTAHAEQKPEKEAAPQPGVIPMQRLMLTNSGYSGGILPPQGGLGAFQ